MAKWNGPTRYFLAHTESYDWFLVEEEKRAQWMAWCQTDSEVTPKYAKYVGDPSKVVFVEPKF